MTIRGPPQKARDPEINISRTGAPHGSCSRLSRCARVAGPLPGSAYCAEMRSTSLINAPSADLALHVAMSQRSERDVDRSLPI